MTVDWFTNENGAGLQGLREPVTNPPDMELYLSNNYANYPAVPDPMFPQQDAGEMLSLMSLINIIVYIIIHHVF